MPYCRNFMRNLCDLFEVAALPFQAYANYVTWSTYGLLIYLYLIPVYANAQMFSWVKTRLRHIIIRTPLWGLVHTLTQSQIVVITHILINQRIPKNNYFDIECGGAFKCYKFIMWKEGAPLP